MLGSLQSLVDPVFVFLLDRRVPRLPLSSGPGRADCLYNFIYVYIHIHDFV